MQQNQENESLLIPPSVQQPLDHILRNDELEKRPSRPPDYKAEAETLAWLAESLADSADTILQKLSDAALKLCGADSAGVSIAEQENGSELFRWRGVSGQLSPFLMGTMPRDFSPCGHVLKTGSHHLMLKMIGHYQYVDQLKLPLYEVLLVPFFVAGNAVGTMWIVAHSDKKKFDSEDLRLLTSLTRFASAGYQSKIRFDYDKAYGADLEASRAEAERANQAKSAFLANMSHEIRSPLGAIMGFSELLRHTDLTTEERSNYLSIIDRNSTQLLRVIDDILDLAKVEAGKMTIENIEFSLSELLADFASIVGFKARENGIKFELYADTPLPEEIISDPTRIRQILNNAVGNAIKFTPFGSVKLKVSYAEQILSFEITDTGRGISPEQAKNLFKPFTQADDSTKRKYGGTGLGLTLTKNLCQALGGDFRMVESQLDKGSTFLATLKTITQPQTQIIPPNEIKFKTTPSRMALDEQKRFSGIRILLVEDSPDNQILIKLMVQKLGGEIVIGSNGREGVDLALSHEVDVVLMDIQMPEMDGHEAVRTLRASGYKKPIIALTAHAMKEEIDRALESGFSSFATKPIEREKLIASVLAEVRGHEKELKSIQA